MATLALSDKSKVDISRTKVNSLCFRVFSASKISVSGELEPFLCMCACLVGVSLCYRRLRNKFNKCRMSEAHCGDSRVDEAEQS